MVQSRIVSDDSLPRAIDGRAPDVFRSGGWVPMRSYGDEEEVDFAIVGTGAGGGTLTYKLASGTSMATPHASGVDGLPP